MFSSLTTLLPKQLLPSTEVKEPSSTLSLQPINLGNNKITTTQPKQTSQGLEIQKIKSCSDKQRKENEPFSFLKEMNKLYVPPKAKHNKNDTESSSFHLDKYVKEFIEKKSMSRVLLVAEDAGSSKSTFMQNMENTFWKE